MAKMKLEGIDNRLKERAWVRASNYMGEDLTGYYTIYSHNRDSTLLDESNWDSLVKQFEKNKRFEIHHFNHWACGWVEALMIDGQRMTVKDYTEILEIINKLEDYPLLDETDYSKREYESTLENIKGELHSATFNYDESDEYKKMESDDLAHKVYSWLSNNDPEQLEIRDDNGGYPTTESISKALLSLNLIKEIPEE
jgi:hypothetical protein